MAHVCRRLDYRPAALQRFEKSLAVTFQLARADTADARHVGEGARLAAQHLQQCGVGEDDVRRHTMLLGQLAAQGA